VARKSIARIAAKWSEIEASMIRQFLKDFPAPATRDLILLVLLFAAAALLVFNRIGDYDFFWHIANGKAMVQQGRIINEEIFSYTRPGAAFSNHEWLAQIILFIIFNSTGPLGIVTFKTMLVTLLAFLLFKTARFCGADRPWAGLLAAFVVLEGIGRYRERPEIFSLLFVGLLCFLLSGYMASRLKKQFLYIIPFVLVLWDFLHGAVYGIVFLLAFVSGESIKHVLRNSLLKRQAVPSLDGDRSIVTLWTITGISLAAMLINPYGLRSYDIFVEFLKKNPMVMVTNEFAPPDFKLFPAFWILLALVFLLSVVFSRKADITRILIMVPFAALALKYNRVTAFFGIVSVPALSTYIALIAKKSFAGKWLRGLAYAFAAMLIGYTLFIKFFALDNPYSFGYKVNDILLPVGSTRFITQSGLKGNMANPGHFGGYLAYYLYPERRISLYNHHLVFGYFPNIISDQSLLDRYGVEYVVLDRVWDKSVNVNLFTPDRWSLVFWDNVSMVLVRNGGINRSLISRYGLRYFTPSVLDALNSYNVQHHLLDAYESNPLTAVALSREISSCIRFYGNKVLADYLGYLVLQYQNYISNADALDYIESALAYNDSSAYLWFADSRFRHRAGDALRAQSSLKKALSLDSSLVHELEQQTR
jgi:hypothetical protein